MRIPVFFKPSRNDLYLFHDHYSWNDQPGIKWNIGTVDGRNMKSPLDSRSVFPRDYDMDVRLPIWASHRVKAGLDAFAREIDR